MRRSINLVAKLQKKTIQGSSVLRRFCNIERETLDTDILIVGGGPAGLATAIRLAQLNKENNKAFDITVIDKGEEIGSHILSGNCFEIGALDQLIPNWKELDAPIQTKVSNDVFKILINEKSSFQVPSFLIPKSLSNHGNYIISLSMLTKWLSGQAEELGINIFTGFSGKSIKYAKDKSSNEDFVEGVITNDFGIDKSGKQKDSFQPGNFIKAKHTVLAEGCRGSLTETVIKKYGLRVNEQHYGLGLKEVWEVDLSKNKNFEPGLVQHTTLWPVDSKTYCGSFMYHMEPNLIHIGLVVGLDYKNPYLNPYEEFQKLKTHPDIKKYLEHSECISYGARALNEGGFYALPKLSFPGGLMVGCAAGMLDVAKIKGAHNAIKSGILAAESIFSSLVESQDEGKRLESYDIAFKKSQIYEDLFKSRNVHGAFSKGGMYFGLFHGFLSNLLNGKEPWSFVPKGKDSEKTGLAIEYKKIDYPKKDGKITFDLLENLSRSGTNHDHDQPIHLKVKDINLPKVSYEQYGAPEERFCPAKVYEFVDDTNEEGKTSKKLQINAQNCLHCKCCSIKMVNEYIEWTVPEGKGGPKYTIL